MAPLLPVGNIVHVKEGLNFFTVSAGSPWWAERSDGKQINFTLPAGLVAGDGIRVYVQSDARSANGCDSNGAFITVLP